jgi:hypothetical protein
MDQGQIDFKYKLCCGGTPRLGDTRPGRLQLVNHSCKPSNNLNTVCNEFHSQDTGPTAYFLHSRQDIKPASGIKVRFPYQEPSFKNEVQVYPANSS